VFSCRKNYSRGLEHSFAVFHNLQLSSYASAIAALVLVFLLNKGLSEPMVEPSSTKFARFCHEKDFGVQSYVFVQFCPIWPFAEGGQTKYISR
jgi:hypothetical protein